LQTKFYRIAVEQCLNHAGSVPNFGADARVKIEIHFRFPYPKTGQIKNTAAIHNLCKFILDACNKTFYGDDGQVVCLYADKDYDHEYGGKGYTKVKIQVNER
jgi:Holliday junction resolvase RusA-like endonuclease